METKCPLPKRFSGTRRVSGILIGLLALALMTASGAGAAPFAYITNRNSDNVTVLDGTTVITPPLAVGTPPGIGVDPQPAGVAVNPAGTRVYVANSNVFNTGVPSVSVIDTATLTVLTTVTVGIAGQPSGVAVSDDGSVVYVANRDGTVAVIDAATNTVVDTLRPPPGEERQLAAIVVAGGSVYATDLFTGEVVNVTDSTMPGLFLSFSIAGIAADLSGSRLYVSYGDIDGNSADGNLKVAIIDVPTSFTDRVQHFTSVRISTPGFLSGAAPGGIAVNRSGTFVYATVPNEKTLAVIDTANNNSVTPIEVNPRAVVNPRPVGVALDPLETRVYVGNSGDGTVTVLDATTQTVVKVGTRPMGLGSFVASTRPPVQYALTLKTVGAGALTAQPEPVGGTYDAGTVVTLTATPTADSQFAGWSGACSGASVTCSVTMDAAKSVTASFTAQYTLLLTTLGGGSITPDLPPTAGKYAAGTRVTLTATPDPGFLFTGWAGACSGNSVTCVVMMDAAKSVTATFTAQYTLFLTTLGGGSITPDLPPTAGKYAAGTKVTLTAAPDPGFLFTGWAGDCSGNSVTCVVTMDLPKSVTATFTAQYTLFLTTLGGGSIAAQPAPVVGKYAAGTVVTLTATPAPGSWFTSWSGACTGSSNPCNVTMDAAKSVTATFTAQYVLTLTNVGAGSIAAQPTPAGGTYAVGTVVTVTAIPASGSQFTSWSGACTGSSNPCTVTMDAAKGVTANFALKQYALTLTTAGTGSGLITAQPAGGTYPHGMMVTLTAVPAANSQFTSWSGACSGSATTCNVTMDMVKGVTANFALKQYALTLTTVGAGSITANPVSVGGMYSHGTVVSLTPTPAAGTVAALTATGAAGSQFSGWSGACSGTGACNVTMDAAKSVTATFTASPPPPSTPTTCDDKITDLQKKVAAEKHPWRHDHQLKAALRLYSAAQVELAKANAKVGDGDKRYVRAMKEFNNGKAGLCTGHYWRAHHELWESYYLAHEILKHYRR